MSLRVDYDERAISQAAAFLDDPHGIREVLDAIDRLADEPRPAGSFPYGSPDLRRLRVGRYRVLYEITEDAVAIRHIARGRQATGHCSKCAVISGSSLSLAVVGKVGLRRSAKMRRRPVAKAVRAAVAARADGFVHAAYRGDLPAVQLGFAAPGAPAGPGGVEARAGALDDQLTDELRQRGDSQGLYEVTTGVVRQCQTHRFERIRPALLVDRATELSNYDPLRSPRYRDHWDLPGT